MPSLMEAMAGSGAELPSFPQSEIATPHEARIAIQHSLEEQMEKYLFAN